MKRLNYFLKVDGHLFSISVMVLLLMLSQQVVAQLKPVNASYFINEYVMNPAMAGTEKVFKANIGFRQQLSSFEGAPQTQFLTADYGFDTKSGVGFKLYSDKAGLLKETTIGISYAYHLPLNGQDHLNFGISGTMSNNKLSAGAIKGNLNDPDALDVNQRKTYIDSDFGISYSSEKLNVQAVFPNMFATINGSRVNESDYLLFFSAISYKIETTLGNLEPKLAFRGVKGFKNIVDFGANMSLHSSTENAISLVAIYHSSKNLSFGFDFVFNNKFGFNTSYTVATSQLNNYTLGDLEVGLSFKL